MGRNTAACATSRGSGSAGRCLGFLAGMAKFIADLRVRSELRENLPRPDTGVRNLVKPNDGRMLRRLVYFDPPGRNAQRGFVIRSTDPPCDIGSWATAVFEFQKPRSAP